MTKLLSALKMTNNQRAEGSFRVPGRRQRWLETHGQGILQTHDRNYGFPLQHGSPSWWKTVPSWRHRPFLSGSLSLPYQLYQMCESRQLRAVAVKASQSSRSRTTITWIIGCPEGTARHTAGKYDLCRTKLLDAVVGKLPLDLVVYHKVTWRTKHPRGSSCNVTTVDPSDSLLLQSLSDDINRPRV